MRARSRESVCVACDRRARCPSHPAALLPAACASCGASAHAARKLGARVQKARERRPALRSAESEAGMVLCNWGPVCSTCVGLQASWTVVQVPDEGLLGKIRAGLSKIKVRLRPAPVRRGRPCAVPRAEEHGRCAAGASRMQMRVCAVVDARFSARVPTEERVLRACRKHLDELVM